MFGGKSRAGYNPRPHLMDEIEHFFIAVIGPVRNSIEPESLRRTSAALIQCGNKSVTFLHPTELFLIHICSPFSLVCRQFFKKRHACQASGFRA